MTTCAIYIRKSREDKDKPSQRLTVQREQLPAHAKAQGWQCAIYDDGHASAAKGKVEDLQQRARLENDIRAGKIDVLLCIELSRLSRDDTLQDYIAWLTLCSNHKVKLATPSRILDPAQHSDWMLLLMEGGFSSVEMKVLQGRMKDGRDQAYREGKFLGGVCPPPYVYDKGQGRPVIDQHQLAECQHIWTMAETNSARAIAQQLGKAEITIRRILSDDRLQFCRAERTDETTGETIKCDWEPCLTSDQAMRIREARSTRSNLKKGKREISSLLSNLGIMYCGYCGRTLKTWHNSRVRADGSRLDYYGCQAKDSRSACDKARLIAQSLLDHAVVSNIFNTLADIDELKASWEAQQSKSIDGIDWVIKEERKAQDKKRRLITAISNGIIELADAKQEMDAVKNRLEYLQQQKDTILNQSAAAPDWESLGLDDNIYYMMAKPEQREFISQIIDRIDVYNMHAIITYKFPRNTSGDTKSKINLPASQRGSRIDNKKAR